MVSDKYKLFQTHQRWCFSLVELDTRILVYGSRLAPSTNSHNRPYTRTRKAADPNLGFQIDKATENMMQQLDIKKISYFGLIFFFGTLLGLVSWSINRNFKNSYMKSIRSPDCDWCYSFISMG